MIPLLVLLLGGSGYALSPLLDDLPSPAVEATIAASTVLDGTEPDLPWPDTGQAVIEIDGVGQMGSSGSEAAIPIASVTKVMTAYVILVDHPLNSGESGPSLTITQAHVDAYQEEVARGESLVSIKVGASFTELQALQAVLLPSANNMARILAEWDAGSTEAFITKMNTTAAALGMSNTTYTDPAGYDPGTVSTASDQVILAQKAMDLPVFAEIVALAKATVPVAGTITNYNGLLGSNGVVGIKTGSTDEAGGCLSFAAEATIDGQEVLIVGAVLGQPGDNTTEQLAAVFKVTKALITAVVNALDTYTVITAGQEVATVTGPLGATTELTAVSDVTVVGWPGLEIEFTTSISDVPSSIAASTDLGTFEVTAGESDPTSVTVRSGDALDAPSIWSRIQHHI